MLRGIYSAASGMIHNQYKEDVGANNIANSGTTGYKKDDVYTEPFPEVKIQDDILPAGQRIIGSMPLGVMPGELRVDFTQGQLLQTGNDLDLAIEGNGFFNVGSKGGPMYTRDGSFSLDRGGMIVSSGGGYLMGKDLATGNVEPISTGGGSVSVSDGGTVYIDSKPRYSIEISYFGNNAALMKRGKNMYTSSTPPGEAPAGSYSIKQGFLEGSNADMSDEMVDMILNLRGYQANQRMLQTENETLDKTVNQLGALR